MKAAPVVLLAAGALFLAWTLSDQFAAGDTYQRGSSLRTDPEGSSVWFEALAGTGLQLNRNFEPLNSFAPRGAAVFFLGVQPGQLADKSFAAAIVRLAQSGNRVLIALDGAPKGDVSPEGWGLTVRGINLDDSADEELPWPAYAEGGSGWQVLRREGDNPVELERSFANGSLAFVASAKPFLNQALRRERDTRLLSWASADQKEVLFDEAHLGLARTGTIMGLIRQLHLPGVLAALLAASLLFFWRASVPFPPVNEKGGEDRIVLAGPNSDSAMRNLLESHVVPAALVETCIAQWAHDFERRTAPDRLSRIREAGAQNTSSAERWEKIRGIIRERTTS
jgi:hypothetical protein